MAILESEPAQPVGIRRDEADRSMIPPGAMMPLERKAAFKSAVTMRQCTAAAAARQLKVSYNHLMLVLNGQRTGSERLCRDIAVFLGCTDVEVFGSRAQRVAPEPRIGTER